MKRILKRIYKRWIRPFASIHLARLIALPKFFRQASEFRAQGGRISELRPILGEDTPTTDIDHHYLYQSVWLGQHLAREKPIKHIDIGSQVSALAILSATTPITFVDIRPPKLTVSNFFVIEGSLSKLPFETGSVQSLSCLHVVEHIGLGRYGDPIKAQGTQKACAELERILASNGTLYLSVPVGKPRIEFNAHRVLSPHAVVELFPNCELIDFSFVDDKGMLHANIPPNAAAQSHYACGMFRFKKRGERNS